MKVRMEYTDRLEEELVWYRNEKNRNEKEIDEQRIKKLARILGKKEQRIAGTCGAHTVLFEIDEIYYLEYVENRVYAYLEHEVVSIPMTLEKAEQIVGDYGFFRCSKTMVVNVNRIKQFQSMIGNRMIATLTNEEKVIVSRRYTKALRAFLKGGSDNEASID